MAVLAQLFSIIYLVMHVLLLSGEAKTLNITNNCTYTIWPAVASKIPNNNSGFALSKGESGVVVITSGWTGQVWGRTLCSTNKSNGNFSCQTGDCPTGNIECLEGSYTKPVTLAEFSLNVVNDDFYDVSVVDGYNLPIMVAPKVESGVGCDVTGCVFDLKKSCVAELAVLSDSSSIIGCRGMCEADKNCCNSAAGCPSTKSSFSPLTYKKSCPRAYSFALNDDKGTTFMCDGSKVSTYTITFCPSPTMSRLFSVPSTNASVPASAPPPPPPAAPPPVPAPVPPPAPPEPGTLPSPIISPAALIPPTNSTTKPKHQNSPSKNSKRKSHMTLIVAFPTAAVLLTLLGISVCICRRKVVKENTVAVKKAEIRRLVDSLQFDFSTIRTATRNFAAENKLEEGGFGEVYKGKLEDGQEIAVKRLSKNSGQGTVEFETEIVLVAKLQHKNLVKLLGYCAAPHESLLVYEFLPNSSLDKFLFDPVKKTFLDWQTRHNIIAGIARGLLYLHEDSRLKVVHRDLKTSNILLDEAMNPKIADFGLARLFGVDQTQGDTKRIVGTYGYMAPEYARSGHYSVKSDVFSFGVIVLEVVSGQRNRLFTHMHNFEALLHRAWRLWIEGEALSLVDTELGNKFEREVLKCIQIGLLCIHENAVDRPRMASVVAALNSRAISLPTPKPPNFFGCMVDDEARDNVNKYGTPYVHTGPISTSDVYSRD